jgi:hypothetical protein
LQRNRRWQQGRLSIIILPRGTAPTGTPHVTNAGELHRGIAYVHPRDPNLGTEQIVSKRSPAAANL